MRYNLHIRLVTDTLGVLCSIVGYACALGAQQVPSMPAPQRMPRACVRTLVNSGIDSTTSCD